MRFKINDTWYSHALGNAMMIELSPQEREQLMATPITLDENDHPVVRHASFVNDAATWNPENKEAWMNDKPIPQPDLALLRPVAPDERTKWEKERLEKGLPIN